MKSPSLFLALGVLLLGVAQGQVSDDDLLDEVQRASFLFFWEQTDPSTGQVKDRALASGAPDPRNIASIAATGFGLGALAIAHQREYMNQSAIEERVLTTLQFLKHNMTNVHGFYYHFVDMGTGERVWNCELSSIDTALLMGGVLTVGEYFKVHEEIATISRELYEAVDYEWMLNGTEFLNMGWTPENGFLNDSWNRYCELMLLVIQAIGSPTHPIPIESWNAFSRPNFTYGNLTYVHFPAPLFVHQFSHSFIDFRGLRDNFTLDYFLNSVTATRATKAFFLDEMSLNFSSYSENFWGLTASDTPSGYEAWGGPPLMGKIDGSIVPCAAGGSIPFLPEETIGVLRNLRYNHTEQAWSYYSFVDAFNPLTNWTNPDVIGIDLGVTMLMAENHRTEFIWKNIMQNPHIKDAMNRIGFLPYPTNSSGWNCMNAKLLFFIVAICKWLNYY